MEEGCTGYDRRTWTYANGPDSGKYEDSADNLSWSTILCSWTSGNRYAPDGDHHICTGGVGIAAPSGASFLCYVTPAEHLRLPNVDDVKEGIMASKIAAHAADIAKGVKGAMDWDNQMAAARQKLDWEKQFELALDPEKARRYRAESTPEREDTCTMCGKMCSVRNMNAVLAGEDVDVI